MSRSAVHALALLGLAFAACADEGEPQRPTQTLPIGTAVAGDSGQHVGLADSGAIALDAGLWPDAGLLADAGLHVDSGPVAVVDAGPPEQLPCAVAAMIKMRCATCHAKPPLPGVPMSLTGYADLVMMSKSNPSLTNAQQAAQLVQSGTMPPGGGLMPAEVQAFTGWVQAGAQPTGCSGADAGH